MANKALVNLNTGLEDAESVTVALLVAVAAAEAGRETRIFLTKEAVRLATEKVAVGTAPASGPSLPDLLQRYADADGRLLVCPVCFNARDLEEASLLENARITGTVPLWEWIGEDDVTTFSY